MFHIDRRTDRQINICNYRATSQLKTYNMDEVDILLICMGLYLHPCDNNQPEPCWNETNALIPNNK